MFGKSLNNYLVSLFFIINFSNLHAQNQDVFINGYQANINHPKLTRALRLQGIGDFFFKKKAYAQAVPYYEEALSILPKEASITFRLAEVYQNEKLWRLSILYYEQTIELLKDPVNYSRSQENSYISRIRIAYVYHLRGDKEKSIALLQQIRNEKSLLESLYPIAFEELKTFDTIYPENAVRVDTTNN